MLVHCIPEDALQALEFDKVLERVRSYCLGPGAANACLEIRPVTQYEWILRELQCGIEAQRILESGLTYFSHGYEELEDSLHELAVPGYVLEAVHIMSISAVLALSMEVYDFFDAERMELYPHLGVIAGEITNTRGMISAIDKVLDREGNVRHDASKTLMAIAQEIQEKRHQCDLAFQRMERDYAARGWLADTLESVRNERRVLAVKAEHKRKIRGIMHDHSATGRTVLIEPEEVIGINNDLFDLRAEYHAEVRKLLLALCDHLRTHLEDIRAAERVVIELDLHLAKGHFGKAIHAQQPTLDAHPRLQMRRAYHPLLLFRNLNADRKTISFDLELHGKNQILLLSGPNAGGKSILMKAVGLLQLMVQSGFPVPVSPDSVFGIFSQISVSLGDHQSIENDLSTYSSKLAEMRDCLAGAGEDSLVLIDEFGSGTDPRLGGAIAEGILEALCDRGVFGVITTHYSELKTYAYRKRGIVNGAMVFDKERMLPTYELRIGKPGSSYTFEIARKSGLPDEVLDYAGMRSSGEQLKAMEDLLADLERQKTSLTKRLARAEQRSQQLDQLVQSYERMQQDLAAQRHRIRLEQKEQDYASLSQMNKELEKTVRLIQEEKDIEAAKSKMKEIRSQRVETRDEITRIHKDLRARQPANHKPLEEGDYVRVFNGTQTGRIERIQKQVATVIMGHLRMDIPLGDLVLAGEPLDIRSEPSVKTDMDTQANFDPRLDLRGMRPREAQALLERFMDLAMVSNIPSVQIIHGKGTGALRKAVVEKLKEYRIREIQQPEDQQGGSGSTVVLL